MRNIKKLTSNKKKYDLPLSKRITLQFKNNWILSFALLCLIQLIFILGYLIIIAINGPCTSVMPPRIQNHIQQESINIQLPIKRTSFIEPKITEELKKLYKDHTNKERIYIAIASYRDNECVNTVINAFETAKYPERLRVGIFQQHNITDGDCEDFDKILKCDPLTGLYIYIYFNIKNEIYIYIF